jgi:hypothetical protein
MAHLTDYKLQRILTRFPWRRRKPRRSDHGEAPIGMKTREGQQLWADPGDLAKFDDPGPALVCVAMHGDQTGHVLVRNLVRHHAETRGIPLPLGVPEVTTAGLEILDALFEDAGLDPDEPLGPHAIGELLTATWAIAAATDATGPPVGTSPPVE